MNLALNQVQHVFSDDCHSQMCRENDAFHIVVGNLHMAVTNPKRIYIERLLCTTCPKDERSECTCYRITEDFDIFIHCYEQYDNYWVLEHDPPFGDESPNLWRLEDNECEPVVSDYVNRFLAHVNEDWFN